MSSRPIVESLLAEMERNVILLEELQRVPQEEFIRDPRHHLLAERCFQLAIQCLLYVCYRLAADAGWPKPQDGPGAIQLLAEKGVLPSAFAQRIAGMANFRNILVHAYLNIRRDVVHSKLAQVGDLREFQRHVLAYLSSRPQGLP
ncbi:MAG: DUF86 domain-containing protein [Planctomycetes bacterium]|nr:DUF86 domain-containing protein [Planctomycetota bacterium]